MLNGRFEVLWLRVIMARRWIRRGSWMAQLWSRKTLGPAAASALPEFRLSPFSEKLANDSPRCLPGNIARSRAARIGAI